MKYLVSGFLFMIMLGCFWVHEYVVYFTGQSCFYWWATPFTVTMYFVGIVCGVAGFLNLMRV